MWIVSIPPFILRQPPLTVMPIGHDVTTDGIVTCGNRSFELKPENVATADHSSASDVERMLEVEFTHSRLVEPEQVGRKPRCLGFAGGVVRVIAHVWKVRETAGAGNLGPARSTIIVQGQTSVEMCWMRDRWLRIGGKP